MKKPASIQGPSRQAIEAVNLTEVRTIDLGMPTPAIALPREGPDAAALATALVENYPPKALLKRTKHIRVNDPVVIPQIEANSRTIPGIISQRGCCYAGCKGVVLGPITDVVHIVHGPVGCSYYAWMTRRSQADVPEGEGNFLNYAFTTDMTENEIIFGGEKKLAAAIREAYELFHPKAIAVFATCPVGLIGDDVHAVATQMRAELGINVFGFSCEGYKGISQSAGHHIANNGLFTHVVGTENLPAEQKLNPWRVNLLGEYNIGGDGFEMERLFAECGIELVSTFSGNAQYSEIARSQDANLNLVMCHRSISYMAEMMETKYGIPWIKVNFIGAGGFDLGHLRGDHDLDARDQLRVVEVPRDLAQRLGGGVRADEVDLDPQDAVLGLHHLGHVADGPVAHDEVEVGILGTGDLGVLRVAAEGGRELDPALGEYNIGGGGFEMERLFAEGGI